ncbi:MAG: hypothetical protein R6W81_07295 [Bacteroidales bacterium]
MDYYYKIPDPFLFNPLKHYAPFIVAYVENRVKDLYGQYPGDLVKELKHLGTSVMDIYKGNLSLDNIFEEIKEILNQKEIITREHFAIWSGTAINSYRIVSLSDDSRWTLRYHDNEKSFAHVFPARSAHHTFRVKANTLKSAILYLVLIGKDYISDADLNKVRALAGLSPVKEIADAEAITRMIEILRG